VNEVTQMAKYGIVLAPSGGSTARPAENERGKRKRTRR
jgi:hypothetical protein